MEFSMKADFAIFKQAADILESLNIDYVVFGGIAVWAYGRKRETKDIDLLINQESADKALLGLLKNSWLTRRTDEKWLFQATKGHVQVDLIFRAKGDFMLTQDLIKRALDLKIAGYEFKVISPEDLIIIKIYALKEIRPADWYDAISVITGIKGNLDWQYIVEKSVKNPTRILSFFLFAQTEETEKYVPKWVIEKLMNMSLKKAA